MWLHTHLIQEMIFTCRETFKGSVHFAWTTVPTYPRYIFIIMIMILIDEFTGGCASRFDFKKVIVEIVEVLMYSGAIGFLLCSTEGPLVNFLDPVNPIEKQEWAVKLRRELRFYNSEVYLFSLLRFWFFLITQKFFRVYRFCLNGIYGFICRFIGLRLLCRPF